MKVQVPAHELKNASIEKVSLVKHGANRTPFRILKSEDAKESTMSALTSQLSKLFQKTEQPPKVTALFVRKSAAPALFPELRKHGYSVEKTAAELHGEVVLLKQEGFDAETEGCIVQLTPDLAIGLDRVVKEFSSWQSSSDFSTTLSTQTFYPSVRMAMDALMETFWAAAYESNTQADFSEKVDAATKAFSKHVTSLAKVLPVEVFKMEADVLKSVFEPRSVGTTAPAKTEEGHDTMNKNVLKREAVAGDLAGLFDEPVTKADEPTAEAAAPAAETAAPTTEATPAPTAEAAAPTGAENVKPAAEAAPTPVAASDASAPSAAPTDPALLAVLATLGDGLKALAAGQTELLKRADAQDQRIDQLTKTATEAVTKAENTSIAASLHGLDESLSTLNGHRRLTKGDEPKADIWKGLIPAFDRIQGVENA